MFPSFDFTATGVRTGKHEGQEETEGRDEAGRTDDGGRKPLRNGQGNAHGSVGEGSCASGGGGGGGGSDANITKQLLRVLPQHPNMRLVSISVQEFKGMSRHAVVMERL